MTDPDAKLAKRVAHVLIAAAALIAFGSLFIDAIIEVVTGYTAPLWVPPLSNSFYTIWGPLVVPASPGAVITTTLVMVYILRGHDISKEDDPDAA